MRNFLKIIILIFCVSFELQASASRVISSINESWHFLCGDSPGAINNESVDSSWDMVNIPHTWNASDATDEIPGYYRGVGWYKRTVFIPEDKKGNEVTIYFEGANQEVELFINGKSAGKHAGGYTRFSFNITELLNFGEKNVFAIRVSNEYNENIPPLSADFTFFGGIYRDIYLIYTNKLHISTTHYASSGVYISIPEVNDKTAKVHIRTLLTNADKSFQSVLVQHTIVSPEGKTVSVISKQVKLPGLSDQYADNQEIVIKNPILWSTDSPELYTVFTQVYDSKNKILLDEVTEPLGLRWFEFSAEKGFVLNGKPIKLIGTSRHQCYEKMGNALPDEMHVRDVLLLKSMGGNFLRVAHYPQDPVVMEMCDKLGIITSVEIPIVNAITENEDFTQNSLEMAKEMVYQDFNRPSVVIWAYMNEVLLRIPAPYKEDLEKKKNYFSSVNELASKIEAQIRKDDSGRYTMIPCHGNFNDYNNAGLTNIPMIVGWNLYQGWYGDSFNKFDTFLDTAHEKLPNVPFIITEYGADVDPRLHSFDPVRFDYTAEYANQYHEHYIKAIKERTFVAGANIWNLNDFHSEERGNAVPHINNKGITTTTRELKDTYLQYRAMCLSQPVVLIGGSNWKIRGGIADTDYTCKQPVKIYSNLEKVELFLNSQSLGYQNVKDNIALFEVPFVNGENTLEAVGFNGNKKVNDMLKIDFRMISYNLKDMALPFREINVMLGSKRYFEDKQASIVWLPEKKYTEGSWGYVGGKNYVKLTRHGSQPASDSEISGTDNDPVFQTMRTGIEAFRLDVPKGQYTISFHWAELQGDTSGKSLVYNLGDDALKEEFSGRVFDVLVNGEKVIPGLDIASEYGVQRAVVKKTIVDVFDDRGITISFNAIKGEPMLNAIRIYRNY